MPTDNNTLQVALPVSSILFGFLFTGFWWILSREVEFESEERRFKLGTLLLFLSMAVLATCGAGDIWNRLAAAGRRQGVSDVSLDLSRDCSDPCFGLRLHADRNGALPRLPEAQVYEGSRMGLLLRDISGCDRARSEMVPVLTDAARQDVQESEPMGTPSSVQQSGVPSAYQKNLSNCKTAGGGVWVGWWVRKQCGLFGPTPLRR